MGTSIQRREPWPAWIEADSAADLQRALARAHRRGEIAASSYMRRTPAGRWSVQVLRLKDPVLHPYRKPVLIAGGTVVVLGGAAAAGWWLSVALAPVVLPLIVAALALIPTGWMVTRGRRGCTITITHRGH